MDNLIPLAEEYCIHFHLGQKRKIGNVPYSQHPFSVRDLLVKYGYDEPEIQIIALLHDTIEDTELGKEKRKIQKKFGSKVYDGVYHLSKNTPGKHVDELLPLFENLGIQIVDNKENLTSQAYKIRILFSKDYIKVIKIADMIHNTRTLSALSKEGVKKKIYDAETFYIPLGKCIAPEIVKELIKNIEDYKKTEDYKNRIEGKI